MTLKTYTSSTQEYRNPLVRKLIHQIDDALNRRSVNEEDWEENVRMLNGKSTDDMDPTLDRCNVNEFWSITHTMIPVLFGQAPDPIVTATTPRGEGAAPILEAALKHYVDEMDVDEIVNEAGVDALCFPWGVIKVGYVTEDIDIKVKVNRKTGEINVIDETERIDLSEFTIERRPGLSGNHPIAMRVSPRNFIFDPRATGLEDAEWVAERFVAHLEDIKSDPTYKDCPDLDQLKATGSVAVPQHSGTMEYGVAQPDIQMASENGPFSQSYTVGVEDEEDLVQGWEVWTRRDRKLYTVVPGQDVLLRDTGWPYDLDGFPYGLIRLGVRIPDEPYPIPFLSVWKTQQRELNRIRSYQLDHIKRSVAKVLVDSSKMDKQTIDALLRGERVPVIPVNGDPSTMVHIIPGAPMNPEVAQVEALIKDDIRFLTGVAEYQRGGTMPVGTTATETRLLAASTTAKIGWMRKQISKTMRWLCRSIKRLLQQYADRPTMIRITGRSDFEWHPFTKDDIQGDFDVQVDAATQVPMDRAVEQKVGLDFMNVAVPIAVQRPDVLDLEACLRFAFDKLEVPTPDRFFTSPDRDRPPSDPESEEILMSQGGIPRVSPNDDHMSHLQIHKQGFMQAQDDLDRWRRGQHVQTHIRAAVEAQVRQQTQMMGAQPGGPPQQQGGPGEPPPVMRPGMMQGGQGRSNPQPGHPIAPRQFAQQAPTEAGTMRSVGKGARP